MSDTTTVSSLVSEVVKAFKATSMYPPSHPSRVRFFQKLLADFTFCLAHDPVLDFRVQDDAITWSGIPLDTRDGSNKFLARECFARQISSLRFNRGVTIEDLQILFELLAMDVEALRDAGGAVEFLRGKGSGLIQIEQVDYEGILERRLEEVFDSEKSHYGLETLSPAAPPEPVVEEEIITPRLIEEHATEMSQDDWIALKLGELDEADSAARYRLILQDIMTSLRETGGIGMPHYTTVVLKHLGKYLLKEVPEEVSRINADAIKTLAQLAAVEEIVSQLTVREQPEREIMEAVLLQSREVSLPVLLGRLAEEKEPFGRRMIISVLGRYGPALKPYLDKWLRDDRWYVVRNALGLLQQVGGPRDSASVKTFLQHPHPKIRLEALRFLYRYPVPVDEELMNRLLEDADVEVQARAVYALGVLMGSSGLLRLISLARKPLIGEGDVALREMAVKGIGREGGERSVKFLSDLMRTRSFINREAGERVQKAAVEALVEIGGPRVLHTLKGALPRLKGQALRSAEDFLRREEVQSS